MFRLFFRFTLLSTLFLSACSAISTPAPTKAQAPTLTGIWTVQMDHSGGIMGVSRSIKISSNGSYTVNDSIAKVSKNGNLSDSELKKLIDIVNSMQYMPSKFPSACADCFIYSIQISGAGKPFNVTVDDVTLSDSGLGPLVMELRAIMNRELK